MREVYTYTGHSESLTVVRDSGGLGGNFSQDAASVVTAAEPK